MRFIQAILLTLLASATAQAQSTYTALIHNAPGWEPSTSYTYSPGPPTAPFTRVVAGAGWAPSGGTKPGAAGRGWLEVLTGKIVGGSGRWNSGAALNAYQLTSVGTCTSASNGSGPSGTGTQITDGTCTWKYVSRVDYISLTGWALDNGSVWTSGTNYGYNHVVHTGTDASVYQQTTAGCHSTVQPTGTQTEITAADGCSWDYKGKIYYTSNSHPLPHEEFYYDAFTGSINGTTLIVAMPPATYALAVGQYLNAPGMAAGTKITAGSGTTWTVNNSQTIASTTIFSSNENDGQVESLDLYVAELWNDREYLSGANGENSPITIWNHNYHYNDAKNIIVLPPANVATGFGYPITIRAAAGESFQDAFSANPNLPLAGYDANNGVGIRGIRVPGLLLQDNALVLDGLQVKSDADLATRMNPTRACNVCRFERSIFEGGTGRNAWAVVDCGAQCYMYNDLFVAHGTGAILFDYGGRLYNSTIVCPDGTCTVAVENTIDWITLFGMVMNGNAMFGFRHLIATFQPKKIGTCTWDCATWQGTNNATDVSASDGNTYPAIAFTGYTGVTMYAQNFATGRPECSFYGPGNRIIPSKCGIRTNVSPSSVFLAWPGNYRINASSLLFGAGAPWGTFNSCGVVIATPPPPPYGTWPGCTVRGDTPDIFGTARPQGNRYDVGAMEFVGSVQAPLHSQSR
jgi:hypothetical protein